MHATIINLAVYYRHSLLTRTATYGDFGAYSINTTMSRKYLQQIHDCIDTLHGVHCTHYVYMHAMETWGSLY